MVKVRKTKIAYLSGLPNSLLPVKKEDYFYFGRYKVPLLYASLLQNWAEAQTGLLPKIKGLILLLDGHLYYLKNDWQTIVNSTVAALEEKEYNYFENFFVVSEKIIADLKMALKGDFRNLFNAVHDLEYPWLFALPMAQAMEDWLKGKVHQSQLSYFFYPHKPTPLMIYRQSLKKYRPADLAKKYRWIGMMHFWGKPNNIERVKEDSNQTRRKITPPKAGRMPFEYRRLAFYSRKLTYYRQYFAELCALASLRLHDLFKEENVLAVRALWLTAEEFLAEFENNQKVSDKTIIERKKSYGLASSIITGRPLVQALKSYLKISPKQIEFSGTIASEGYAKGKVKVIATPSDLAKMKPGNILVAHETTPDFVTAMGKAAAIITEIGGLTSHAAIVSRELGIPCIIGTKVATQVLKDGDLVEVDANQGIIKKIIHGEISK